MKHLMWLAMFAANLVFAIGGEGGFISHFNAFVAGVLFMVVIEDAMKLWMGRVHD